MRHCRAVVDEVDAGRLTAPVQAHLDAIRRLQERAAYPTDRTQVTVAVSRRSTRPAREAVLARTDPTVETDAPCARRGQVLGRRLRIDPGPLPVPR